MNLLLRRDPYWSVSLNKVNARNDFYLIISPFFFCHRSLPWDQTSSECLWLHLSFYLNTSKFILPLAVSGVFPENSPLPLGDFRCLCFIKLMFAKNFCNIWHAMIDVTKDNYAVQPSFSWQPLRRVDYTTAHSRYQRIRCHFLGYMFFFPGYFNSPVSSNFPYLHVL